MAYQALSDQAKQVLKKCYFYIKIKIAIPNGRLRTGGRSIKMQKLSFKRFIFFIVLLLLLPIFPFPQETSIDPTNLAFKSQARYPCPPLKVGTYFLGLSPQGNSIYVQFKQGNEGFLQINEKIYGGSEQQIQSEPFFAINAEDRYCFTYRKNKLEYIATSWGKVYGGVPSLSSLAISANGKEVAFAYKKDKNYFVNLNDRPYSQDSFDWVGNVRFFKDNQPIFTYMQGPLKYFLHLANQSLGPFSSSPSLAVSRDAAHYGLISAQDKNYFVMVDGKIVHEDKNYLTDLTLSRTAANYAWVSVADDKCFVNTAYKRFGPYEDISYIFFAEDESKLGFVFKNHKGFFAQFADRTYGPFAAVRDACYSASATYKAFVLLKSFGDENSYLQLNDKIIASFKGSISIRWRGEDLIVGYYEKEALHLAVLSLK